MTAYLAATEGRLTGAEPAGAPAPIGAGCDGTYLQRVAVVYEYPVVFTRGLFRLDSPIFKDTLSRLERGRRHRFVCFLDDRVGQARPGLKAQIEAYAHHYAQSLQLAAPIIEVAGGEGAKNNPSLVEALQRRLLELAIDRHSYVVAIGGGAVLDLIGYVAATTHRGVRHVRVPTTVLAQNDSGVGVKNGVNAFGVKNLLGSFSPPFAVLSDLDFIDTLSRRDKIAGMAEAVKVALIRDVAFFEWMEAQRPALAALQPDAMSYVIRRCAELHMHHIAGCGDPFEHGSARPLDYGHWAAHKLEAMTRHDLRHGEAVAIGLALDARYAVLRGMLAAGEEERICRLLEALGVVLWHPALEARAPDGSLAVLDGLREFREHLGGDLTVTLLQRVGQGVEVHEMDAVRVAEAVAWLRRRGRHR